MVAHVAPARRITTAPPGPFSFLGKPTMNFSVKEQYALRHAARVAFAARFSLRAEAADPIVETYVARQEELVADSQAIIARADAEKRELSVEDKAAITNNSAEVERLQGEIEQ